MAGLPLVRKSLGQHWLTDQASLEKICLAADLKPSDIVLEIGPGLGDLTELLLKRSARVIAVEIDQALADQLSKRLNDQKLEIVVQDILRFNLQTLPPNYKVVANIPYYLTGRLIRLLSESPLQPIMAVLLVQREVAQRATAQPGSMSLLSVSAQFYWQASVGPIIPAKLFSPVPKVDSQVLILKRPSKPLFPDLDNQLFFRIAKAGFAGRRKKLLNSLSDGLRVEKTTIARSLEKAKINPDLRAQNLSVAQWEQLYRQVSAELT